MYYLLLTDSGEPECYEEALQVETKNKWELAMDDEMEFLMKNQTWDLVKLPENKKALHNKWVYRVKEENESTKRCKARLVLKEFQWRKDIDFTESFSHVVKLTTIRSILSIVTAENLHLEQLDVKIAFLLWFGGGHLYDAAIGIYLVGKEHLVCKVKKSLNDRKTSSYVLTL